jgi:6-phosphogluconolactonase
MKTLHDSRKVIILEDAEKAAEFAAIKFIEIAENSIQERGRFIAALSGGKTPISLYRKLAELQKPIAWDRTHIFIVDERFVAFDHEASNYRMIQTSLLNHINIPTGNIHPIASDTESPQKSAQRYEDELRSFFRIGKLEIPHLDLILLGMGKDGHTASLFPGSETIKEAHHLATAVTPPDISMTERVTLTFPLINCAKNIIFLVTGNDKASIVRDVVENETDTLPASLVRPEKGRLFFFLDEQAGSFLFRKDS